MQNHSVGLRSTPEAGHLATLDHSNSKKSSVEEAAIEAFEALAEAEEDAAWAECGLRRKR
jgi:hypothetical protein